MKTKVDIPGYEGLYYVTDDGIVYNAKNNKPRKAVLHGKTDRYKGTYIVTLMKNGVRYQKTMSWIMRQCFFDGKDGCLVHKDGARSNFNLYNLDFMTRKQCDSIKRSVTRKPVIHRKSDGTEDIYRSATEAAKALYVSEQSISRWCLDYKKGKKANTLIGGDFFYEE